MIWADKITLLIAGVLFFFIYLLTNVMVPQSGAAVPLFDLLWIKVCAMTILPLWLFLRGLDAAAGGPARRRGQIR